MSIDPVLARSLAPARVDELGRSRAPSEGAKASLASAASDFEALLLKQAFANADRPMFEDVPLVGGSAEKLYRDLFVDEVAARAAQAGGIGLADAIASQEDAS